MSQTRFLDFLTVSADLDEEAFVAHYPAPALIIEPFQIVEFHAPLTRKISAQLLEPNVEPPPAPRDVEATASWPAEGPASWKRTTQRFVHPDATIAWLLPGPNNQVAGLLSAGRGQSNDLVFANDTVSTFHLLLHERADHWLIEDYDAANGTFLNGHRLPPFERRRLDDRAAIRLGNAVVAKCFFAATLWRFCRLIRSMQERSG